MTRFRWNDWNRSSATKHGCNMEEIEQVARREMRAGRVGRNRDDTYRLEGRGTGGRVVEIVFVLDEKNEIWDDDEVIYVIHAMPLTTRRRRS